MGIQDTQFRTISCNGAGCDKKVTHAFSKEGAAEAFAANPWLATTRTVTTPDGRVLVYCTDVCEVSGVSSGVHNKPEEKKIINIEEGKAQIAMRQMAELAAKQAESDRALKAGAPIVVPEG